ncbi:MAG: hypothetical protein JWQ71_3025 [Pedosphaera sp.]|nr:hypothetical protein [Pedosphaera sp.]
MIPRMTSFFCAPPCAIHLRLRIVGEVENGEDVMLYFQRAVQRMGGKAEVHSSTMKEGSTFVIPLPYSPAGEHQISSSPD